MTSFTIPQNLIDRLAAGKCAAFVGAGLSVGAGLPTWKQLMERMIKWCEDNAIVLPKNSDLETLLQKNEFLTLGNELVERLTETQFQSLMTAEFRSDNLKPTSAHVLLTEIPFRAVLTTNYDKLIETAYVVQKNSASISVFTQLDTAELSAALRNDDFYVLKTHGDISRIKSLVLSGNQYRDLMHSNPAYKKFLESFLTSNTLLFLGFSLADPDLTMILDGLKSAFENHTTTHYALLPDSHVTELEIDRFRKDYGIEIITYTPSDSSHKEVIEFLDEIKRRTPVPLHRHIAKATQEAEDLDPHLRWVANTKGEFLLEEKYPDSAKNADLGFKVTISAEAFEAFKNLEETGEKTTIPIEQVLKVDFPEIFKKVFGELGPGEITMGTAKFGKPIVVRLHFASVDGRSATIDNIELKPISAGTKKAVLSNEHQKYFLDVRVTMNFDSNFMDFSLTGHYFGINVSQAMTLDNFFEIAALGGQLFVEFAETGVRLGQSRIEAGTIMPQNRYWRRIIQDLALIQKEKGILFNVPEIINESDEKEVIDTARILRDGKATGTLNTTVIIPREVATKMVSGTGSVSLTHSADHRPVVLGQRINLGAVWFAAQEMIFTKDESQRVQEILAKDQDLSEISCRISTPPDNECSIYYPELLAKDDFESLFENELFRQSSFKELIGNLVESSRQENGEIDISQLATFFKLAKEQESRFQTSFNMLGRYNDNELEKVLQPIIAELGATTSDLFLALLETESVISSADRNFVTNRV